MKKIITFCLVLVCICGYAQNIDSFLLAPQILKLSISNPQPRLQEKFQITLEYQHVKANIFRSLIGKVKGCDEFGASKDKEMVLSVCATSKGLNEVGPLKFEINGTVYTSNKISYEVIDALPNEDEGLWMRKVDINDSVFCIIIEQRIPAKTNIEKHKDKSIHYSVEPESNEIAKFKSTYSINGLSGMNSNTETKTSSIRDSKGEQKQFLYAHAIYYFEIEDKSIPITITKDKFENLPSGYKFKEIKIQ